MILVFGSGGQLGQELADSYGIPLHGIARGRADIADRAQVECALANTTARVVINAGAYTKVDRAEAGVDVAFRANATGPDVLAHACADRGLPLIHVSIDYVFDGSRAGAYQESDPIAPLGIYGRSKAAGEAAIRHALPHHVIVRTSWGYGIYVANFLKTILRLAGERGELGIVEAQEPFTRRSPSVTPICTDDYPTPAARPVNSELDSDLFSRTFGYTAQPWEKAVDAAIAILLGGNFNPRNFSNSDKK